MTLARTGQNFINGYYRPEYISKRILEPFYNASIVPQITNEDYLGELKGAYGETVQVVKRPAVNFQDTTVNAPRDWTAVIEERTSFTLSYLKNVSAMISKVDKSTSFKNPMLDVEADIVEKMKYEVESAVLQGAQASAGLTHDCATAWTTAGKPTLDVMLAGAKLTGQNVPQAGRFMVLDPVSMTYLAVEQSLWAQNAGTPTNPFKSGQIGTLRGGMEVYESNLLAHDGTGAGTDGNQMLCYMGHKSAITMAIAFKNMEHFDKLESYADMEALSATLMFGYGVVRPAALLVLKPLWA